MQKRYVLLAIVAALVIVLAASYVLFGVFRPQPAPADKLTLGVSTSPLQCLIIVAHAQGYFAQNGLDVAIKKYPSTAEAVQSVLSKSSDVATATEFVFVTSTFQPNSLRIIGAIAQSEFITLLARKDRGIQQPADLKGKKIGVTPKTQTAFYLSRYLFFNHIAAADVQIVNLGAADLVEAIANGQVDAVMHWEPSVSLIQKRLGDNVLSWPGQNNQPYYFLLTTTVDFTQTRPATLARLYRALLQAQEYVSSNVAAAQALVAQDNGLDETQMRSIWPKGRYMLSFPQALLIAMDDEARWAIESGLVTGQPAVPNYLSLLYLDGLQAVAPQAVTVIH